MEPELGGRQQPEADQRQQHGDSEQQLADGSTPKA
jgi:hypothetical protein